MVRRIQGCGASSAALRQRAPLDIVIPTTSSLPTCRRRAAPRRGEARFQHDVLGAVKVWPENAGVWVKAGTTANLDSPCARQLTERVGRDGETGFQVEQRNWRQEVKQESGECRESSA